MYSLFNSRFPSPYVNSLSYRYFFAEDYCRMYTEPASAAFRYLFNYRLGEDLTITPKTTEQYFQASAKNRYIKSVTVKAIPATTTTPATPGA